MPSSNRFSFLKRQLIRMTLRSWRLPLFFLIAMIAALGTSIVARAAVSISATKTFAFIGGDGDGKADPGETIEYTVTVTNSGTTDSANVSLSDIIDANTTLVGGSVDVSPLAINDAYDTIGNTLLEVGGAAGPDPAVHVNGSLFNNDVEFLSDAGIFNIGSHTNPANGTLVSFSNSTGAFSYLPNAGFTGTDTFTYTLQDSGGLTDTGTVTITVTTAKVWYVKNNAAAGGLGRSTDPFDTLLEAQNASALNDTIYIFAGNGTTSGQNLGITLLNGQRLLGEAVALTVPVSVNGGPNPTVLRVAGVMPQIDNTTGGGNGVSVSNVSNIEIRGLNIAGSVNAVDFTTNGANSGSFEIANNIIRSAGSEGIDINGSGTGTLTVNLHNNTVTATGNGIDIQRGGGNITITTFNDNVVTGATGGIGININGNSGNEILFDAVPGGNYDTVQWGSTVIGQSGNGVATSGLILNNVRGDLNFAGLSIYADNGTALLVDGTSSSYSAGSGTRITATTNSPVLQAIGGPALNVTQAAINLTPTTFSSANSASTGLSLVETSGTFGAPASSSITNASSQDIYITGNNIASATVTTAYAGTITDDLGTLVQVTNTIGGTHTFSGAITDGDDGDGSGVSLTNNPGTTITFSGGLVLSTGSNTTFNATGGGTINICDENPCNNSTTGTLVNTLTSTTSTVLNVINTTIGANNLEIRSISSTGNSNLDAVVLNNTGAAGGLKVTGNGGTCTSSATCTGGTIANKTGTDGNDSTGNGIFLTNTANVSLAFMQLNDFGNFAIRGTGVTGFSLSNSHINGLNGDNVASPYNEGSISFSGVLGTVSITNNDIRGGRQRNVRIINSSGTSDITISNNTIRDTSTLTGGDDNLFIEANNTATITAHVNGNTFKNSYGDHIQTNTHDSATLNIVFTNNLFSSADAGWAPLVLGGGITISGGNDGSTEHVNFNISNNGTAGSPLTGDIGGGTININQGAGGGTWQGQVSNNVIGDPVIANSGSAQSGGIRVENHSATGTMKAVVDNNFVRQTNNGPMIRFQVGDTGNINASIDLTIRNNTLSNPGSSSQHGISGNFGADTAGSNAVCVDIRSNDINLTATPPNGGSNIRLRQRNGSTVRLPGYSGANNNTAAVNTLEAGQNTLTPGGNVTSTVAVPPGGGFVGGASCAMPTIVTMEPVGNRVLAEEIPADKLVLAAELPQPVPLLESTTFLPSPVSELFQTASIATQQKTLASSEVKSSNSQEQLYSEKHAPLKSGETLSVNIGTLPAGKHVTIKFQVTVDNPLPLGTLQISNQGTISYDGGSTVLTDDPAVAGSADPTVIQVDRPETAIISINRALPNPTNSASVSWLVTFADATEYLTASNFSLVNTGLGGTPAIVSVNTSSPSAPDTAWIVTATTGSGSGSLGLNLVNDNGLAHDITNSPFTGQVYTIDRVLPTVTINQAAGQPDPTSLSPINYTVIFSEPVNDFVTGDVTISGTAGPTTAVVTEIAPNDGTTYNVAVSGMTSDGTVIASVGAGVAHDGATNGNTIFTTSDNSVTYDTTGPVVTVNQAAGQADPTKNTPINFTVVFNEPAFGFTFGDITLGGTAGATTAVVTEIAPFNKMVFNATVSGMTGDGTVTASIGAGKVQDGLGNNNSPSTSGDNSVTYDTTAPIITFSSKPSNPTNSYPFSFGFNANELVTGFNCTLVGFIGPVSCTSPYSNSVAADGNYTFVVDANDLAGNHGTVSYPWVVDKTGPDTSITSSPSDPTTNPDASFNFTGSDTGGVGIASFECALDGGSFAGCTSPKSYTGLSYTTHTFQVRAIDNAGNVDPSPASFSWAVVNDPPVVTTSGSTPSYTELAAPVIIDSGITVTDSDNATQAGATISINAGFVLGDDLTFVNQNGISGSYNPATGVLTLTGSASVANYQTALRSITYSSSSHNPTNYDINLSRTLAWITTDGTSPSAAAASTIGIIGINEPPVLAAGGTATYLQSGAAVPLDPALTVTDPDTQTLANATVAFESGFNTGDTLVFVNQNGISGSYNSATGVLTLSGSSSLANYQTALRSIAFTSTSTNPTNSGTNMIRTFFWNVNDGLLNSGTETSSLTVVPPDLTATKTNNVGGVTALPAGWTWTIHVANENGAPAAFNAGNTIFTDTLPASGLTYGAPSIINPVFTTGSANIQCTIIANDLSCVANGGLVTLGATTGAFDIGIFVTPHMVATYANPRTSGVCEVDPNNEIGELDEGNNDCSDNVIVNKAVTTTSLVSSVNPSVFGQVVDLTATVSSAAGTPAGTVEFFDGMTSLGTGTLDATGTTTLSISTLSVGSSPHLLKASYSGAANYETSTSTVLSQAVFKADTTTGLSVSINPSVFGQTVTFTATVVANAPGAGSVTGSVSFFDGATTIGTAILDTGGLATLSTSTLSVTGSPHTVTAVYSGDGNFNGSTSSALSQNVLPANTSTGLTSTPNPSSFGQVVSFTATVTASAPGAGTPTGTMEFFDGATSLGTATLNGSRQATLATSSLSAGTHSITTVYAGDTDFNSSSSVSVSQVVILVPVITSTDHSTFTIGSAGTFTVTTTAYPTVTIITQSGTLPTGIGFIDNGDGTATLSGTPAAGSSGIYHLTLIASNGSGIDATQNFSLTVDEVPAITSANNVTFTFDGSGTFTVTTTGYPVPAITESGALPAGVTFTDKADGTATLSGLPSTGTEGTYSIIITAGNGVAPNATQPFTLLVENTPSVVSINSSADTGDGQVLEGENTKAGITQLMAVFSNDMNGSEAQAISNYSLVLDGITNITIEGIGYNAATKTATLNVNGGIALVDGAYALTVKTSLHDSGGIALQADFVRHFVVDTVAPVIISQGVIGLPGNSIIVDNNSYAAHFNRVTVTFDNDVQDLIGDGKAEDVTNPANYLLLQKGPNGIYDTPSCVGMIGGLPLGDDIQIPTGPVTYNSGNFTASVTVNNGTLLPSGEYRLFICGTTSITDLAGNLLNGGSDSILTFTLFNPTNSTLPGTGFAAGRTTPLPDQPANEAYTALGNFWLEIPRLGVMIPIVGVPANGNTWDVSWLGNQAGWLNGTAYPTSSGNSVLTGHVYLANGKPGPFVSLNTLWWGDKIIVHAGDAQYVYEVRSVMQVTPGSVSAALKHEDLPWLTLMTCRGYDESSNSYLYRIIVRAVLVSVK